MRLLTRAMIFGFCSTFNVSITRFTSVKQIWYLMNFIFSYLDSDYGRNLIPWLITLTFLQQQQCRHDRCCKMTVYGSFNRAKFSIKFSTPLTLPICLFPPILSHSQYFFFLLLIFLIELVAGVLAYVYYQRVSEYFLALTLGYRCSSNDDTTFSVTVKWSL